jgi:hypothetical protein
LDATDDPAQTVVECLGLGEPGTEQELGSRVVAEHDVFVATIKDGHALGGLLVLEVNAHLAKITRELVLITRGLVLDDETEEAMDVFLLGLGAGMRGLPEARLSGRRRDVHRGSRSAITSQA